ncbi:D-glycerate dehydrogenase [Candidatus Woesearchaeota archaeon]|nr:D-glycerate dehydrogenase [Candidatus Woesearchaeota archaeon]
MRKFKVFVARKIPDIGIDILKKAGVEVEVNNDAEKVLSKKELIKKIKNKDALLSLLTDNVDEEVLFNSNLKVVANYAVGFNNIDLNAATKKGILVTNTPDVLTETVAEHTLALMMAVARRIVEADKFTKQNKYKAWGPLLFLGQDLKWKTLGIVGLGRIGFAVAHKAVKGMGMKVIYNTLKQDKLFEKEYDAKFVKLERLLKESDFISIHAPLTPETKHLLSFKQFKLMKNNAILINTARGPIVDEKALVEALKNKRISGAALDVFECEPNITCHPASKWQLKNFDNVILTPHIASASVETRNKMAVLAAKSIVDVAKNKIPLNVINRDVLKKWQK